MHESGRILVEYMRRMIRILLLICIVCSFSGCGDKGKEADSTASEEGKTLWTLTQYGDTTGLQASFYTIVSDEGQVVVVDGGHEENAPYVEMVRAESGNHVDVWILTHPHPDHIGAFLRVMEDGEVTVDAIYDNGVDPKVYTALAQEWDEPKIYERYLELTEGWSEVKSAKKGDEVSLPGLSIRFFWSYEPGMEQTIGDIHNNSSLVFQVKTQERSVLFVGDCHQDLVAERLLEENAEGLSSDYVQMGHHGNNTLPYSFYEKVSPKGVFFDAPEWLLTGEQYDAKTNYEQMKQLADEIYDYRTTPNKVCLYETDGR